ncbi:sn-glycerol-3-phosphate ABC transporter ATP-binding protein UgpC [Sinimarinibacterium sp. CAU 1509]|uniref:ABC transporter ATP-binding protein n=1 Tax=Sinimarinibacterium sp. CAU 1509 TaxID=2562283 RepID=UPI0010ACA2E9|nr:sn-glycerol-3-phosphate ABC transporter ATP-binding protein UgpC [Sinimarinibacterium sp. CAU 1509]TJY58202.1 sn-glycerol-3-phosphate ABC transporter ATP-binding protein UgpC [Sinimarinibacterium sp. CAU 1509]
MAAITLENISKRFGRTEVIRDVSLRVDDGEFVVFVGPSGCGKSTLLRLIAGLEDIDSGRVLFDGDDVSTQAPSARGIAMVFQSYALYPHMSVYDNLAFGLKLAKAERSQLDARVREAARVLQIENLLERKPKELSGGQRQRVAIGRAIVRSPRAFLFDEPLSNLDAGLRVQMRIELARLHRQFGTTMIYVTHDQVEAMTLASRIVVLNQGRVEQVSTPLDLYQQPRNRFVAGFIGSPKMNFVAGTVLRCDGDTVQIDPGRGAPVQARTPAAATLTPGAAITLGLRPEHLQLGTTADSTLEGEVVAVEQLGSEAYVYVDAPGGEEPLVIRTDDVSTVQVGAHVRIGVPADAGYLFNADGEALPRLA